MDRASKGLFCQLVLIPLLRDHRILAQVAGHDLTVIKLLPPLVLSEEDLDWTVRGFAAVIGDSRSLARLVDLGRTLAGHALRKRAHAA
jgi:ornithine--oxo-acid transaminase